jgi:hypothetical protein
MGEEQPPSMAELGRTLERNHQETSGRIADLKAQNADLKAQNARDLQTIVERLERYVLQAVYEADKRSAAISQQAMTDRIERVDQTTNDRIDRVVEELTTTRHGNRTAFWAAVGAIVAAMAGAAGAYLLARGGK